jgi:hypothetical protein
VSASTLSFGGGGSVIGVANVHHIKHHIKEQKVNNVENAFKPKQEVTL